MVNITVIGWYGTETIGDRAILAGLIRMFGEVYGDFQLRLGSLFPVLSERTLVEDGDFLKRCSGHRLSALSVFPALNHRVLKREICASDLVVVGGGPLMDMPLLYLFEYAFRTARRHRVKCALLGCGWGPLRGKEYIECAVRIAGASDLTIFRDARSLQQYGVHAGPAGNRATHLIDPAFFAAGFYLDRVVAEPRGEDFVAVNFRDIALDQYRGDPESYERRFDRLLEGLTAVTSQPVRLIPMHTFAIGGDDRVILEKICRRAGGRQVTVQHDPLSLEETMNLYYQASLCVGMRFHAIVLQTVLNGKNYILDYTDPKTGKIAGMLDELRLLPFYGERYCSLLTNDATFGIDTGCERFTFAEGVLSGYFDTYKERIGALLT